MKEEGNKKAHFYNLIKKISLNNPIDLFIDMDVVIASYDFGYPLDFKNKRPLITNINTLKKISNLKKVNIFILSICRENYQIKDLLIMMLIRKKNYILI